MGCTSGAGPPVHFPLNESCFTCTKAAPQSAAPHVGLHKVQWSRFGTHHGMGANGSHGLGSYNCQISPLCNKNSLWSKALLFPSFEQLREENGEMTACKVCIMSIPKWKVWFIGTWNFQYVWPVKFDVVNYSRLWGQRGDGHLIMYGQSQTSVPFAAQLFEIAHTWSNDHPFPLWGISN